MRRALRDQPKHAKPACTARTGARAIAVAALGLLQLLAACDAIFGPNDEQSWWYYCDETGCYRCNRRGCEMHGGQLGCSSDQQCPGGSCDTYSGVCVSNPRTCALTSQCAATYVCLNATCQPTTGPCASNQACGAGAYCSNGVCKNSGTCDSDRGCNAGFTCDGRGSCVPKVGPKTCTSASQCSGGLCVGGQCATCSGDCGGGKTCQFGVHCGSGRSCLDGQCTSVCTKDSDCGSSQQCSGKVCVDSTCYVDCTSGGKCSSSDDACSAPLQASNGSSVRICVADHTAKPECKLTKDCKNNEQCVNGVCRTVCTSSKDCQNCNDGPVCAAGGFCMTATENKPQCKVNSDCSTTGQVCLNSQCTKL